MTTLVLLALGLAAACGADKVVQTKNPNHTDEFAQQFSRSSGPLKAKASDELGKALSQLLSQIRF